MNKPRVLVYLLICFAIFESSVLNAQVFKKAEPVVCPADPHSYDTFVAPPDIFLKKSSQKGRAVNTNFKSEIIVTYNGFTEEAQVAFQYAVDIWASLLDSPVPIYITANFSDLGSGVLGSAGPSSFVRDFEGAPHGRTYYSIALAEKLAAKNLNIDGEADINAVFSNTFEFYFGTDGRTPASKYDFVTLVLHELGHGLGFTTMRQFDTATGIGFYNLDVYNQYIESADSTLLTSLTNSSVEIGNIFTGNNLFFNGMLSVQELGSRPKLYAPSTFSLGSSIAHLDEAMYPARNENSLMSPQFGRGEAIHDPGIVLDMFADMGWVHTYLVHKNENEITNNMVDPFTVELEVTSDTTINILSPVVTYTYSDFDNSVDLQLADTGDGITFTADIPNLGQGIIKYYFSGVQDGLERDYTSPDSTPENHYQINILNPVEKSVPYLTSDGGSFELNQTDFQTVSLSQDESLWELGIPSNRLNQTFSGANVWKTKLDSDIPRPSKNTVSALVSPYFDFSDDTKNHTLSFSYSMENAFSTIGGQEVLFDDGPYGFHIQYSTDGGNSWSLLGNIDDPRGENWYNVNSSVFPQTSNAGWIKQTIEVVDPDTTFVEERVSYNVSHLTGNDRVVFIIVFYVSPDSIDSGYDVDGVLIDDFEILKSSPTAEFSTSSSEVVFVGSEVQFEYLSTGASTYLWEFGDGATSGIENPTHAYSTGGSFDVKLTITSPDGTASQTKEKLIIIISQKSVPYLLADGGDLESSDPELLISNISGTGFELGSSSIAGKSGTSSGSQAYVTGIDATEYLDRSEAYIYTPQFDFSSLGNYELSFMANYSFEVGWDGFNVEYSIDNGSNWLQLNPVAEEGWYDQIAVNNGDGFWSGTPIFTGTTNNSFEKKMTDVSFLSGEDLVSFRVKFLSDGAVTEVGMAFDDFELIGPSGPAIVNFSFEGNTGCTGQSVTFTNQSTGVIQQLDWDFGEGATPSTAQGIDPHTVVFESEEFSMNNIKLTATSSVNGMVEIEKSISTNPTFEVEPFTINESVLLAPEADSYQWLRNGELIENATERELTITDYGNTYSVIAFQGECGIESTQQSVVAGSKIDFEQFGIKIYPNPTKSFINIASNDFVSNQMTVNIYAYNGKRIYYEMIDARVNKFNKQINLSSHESGLYFLELIIDGERITEKILLH